MILSFDKYTWNAYCVPGIVQGAGERTNHSSCTETAPLPWAGGGGRERKKERRIVTDVLGEVNWIQGPAKPVNVWKSSSSSLGS